MYKIYYVYLLLYIKYFIRILEFSEYSKKFMIIYKYLIKLLKAIFNLNMNIEM